MDNLHLRPVRPEDNPVLAAIIRSAFREFHLDKPGTAFFDSALDDMYSTFQVPGSRYFVGCSGGRIAGGGGIYPSPGLPPGICELVKMYLVPSMRGKGLGRLLLDECLRTARRSGYRQVYIESMPEFGKAISLYEKLGFRRLDSALGNTGHYTCSVWMLKDL
ncbi:MAG TPA: GNAT family N-acetyltransferase [Puia sp.]|nr:GNAT family N-acetyltransferase [Puia sp.]